MIFTTWVFGLFSLVGYGAYWALVPRRFKPHYLVAIGIVFYSYGAPAYLALIGALALITYAAARAMVRVERRRRSPYLTASVVAIVGVLVAFKYTNFFASIVNDVARHQILPLPNLTVPLAISFFTFEFVHVLVDVYYGRIARLDALEFATFAMFFPTLVAGPIKRYESFAPQVRTITVPVGYDVTLNIYRVVLGLTKKTIVADSMNAFTAPLLAPAGLYGRIDFAIAVLAYTTKIYFDFSGYSDIAIGLSGLLGLRIPENFDMPYRAANVSEFWRRWHMSLSSWIRDYIFIPLGGSRGSPLVTALNVLLAMAIAGLWHGAAWTFVLWGLWHGAGLIAHRTWTSEVVSRIAVLRSGKPHVRVLSVAATFAFVATSWILFAATSLANAMLVFRGIFL